MDSFFVGLLMALSGTGPNFPATGTGFVLQFAGERSESTWQIGTFGTAGGPSTARAPYRCTSTCTVDFTQTVSGLQVAQADGYLLAPTFSFSGPAATVTAVQTCVGCEPFGYTYVTTWSPVPITVSARLPVRDVLDNTKVTMIDIVGTGTATAYSYWENDVGPWNYGYVRWDFTYAVVPEVSASAMTGAGSLILALVLGRRRRSRLPAAPL